METNSISLGGNLRLVLQYPQTTMQDLYSGDAVSLLFGCTGYWKHEDGSMYVVGSLEDLRTLQGKLLDLYDVLFVNGVAYIREKPSARVKRMTQADFIAYKPTGGYYHGK